MKMPCLTCTPRHMYKSNFSAHLLQNLYLWWKIQTTYCSLIYMAESQRTLHLLRGIWAELSEFTNSKHQAEDAEHMNDCKRAQHAQHLETANCWHWVTGRILTLTSWWRACQLCTVCHMKYLLLYDITCSFDGWMFTDCIPLQIVDTQILKKRYNTLAQILIVISTWEIGKN